jgi:hypothetical protein
LGGDCTHAATVWDNVPGFVEAALTCRMVWDAWDDDGVSDGMELIVAWPSDRVML